MRESLGGQYIANICNIVQNSQSSFFGTSPMLSKFDYFELQSNETKLWGYLRNIRSGKNVVVSDQCAIWIDERYKSVETERDTVTIGCSALPSLRLRTNVTNGEPEKDLYKLYIDTILTFEENDTENHVDDLLKLYVNRLSMDAKKTTDFIVIPVAIVGDGGHQCVLILRRDKPPFWFDPNGRWNMAQEKLSLTSKLHVIELITSLLERMKRVSNERVKRFLTEIPRLGRSRDGQFAWRANTTVNIHDNITQIYGQNERNWFLPGARKTDYLNEDEGICFTTSVVFILGLVCQENPERYLEHQWWDTFHGNLVRQIPPNNKKFKDKFIDFICTMLHRSIMYHVYRMMHGVIPENEDITYFDYDECMRTYKTLTQTKDETQMKKNAEKIADSCMLKELRVYWSTTQNNQIRIKIDPEKYTDVLRSVTQELGDATNGNHWDTSLRHEIVRSLLTEIASRHGYVLNIIRS